MIPHPPPRPALAYYEPTRSGESPAARSIALLLNEQIARWAATHLGDALRQLEQAAADASVADWSQPGDQPIAPAAYLQARRFLAALLPLAPLPDVSVEPSGEPAFDWDFPRGRWLVASIAGDGKMTFASQNGTERLRGVEQFTGSVPPRIASLLSDLQRV